MKRMKWVALALAAMMLLCAVGSAGAEASGGLEPLTISVHPSGHGLPAYIALEKGWFEEAGLDVEMLVYISAAPQMEAYNAGAWELGTTGFGGIVLGVAKNDFQIIGASIDDADLMGYWVREDNPIAVSGKGHVDGYPELYGTPDDWRGQEVLFMQGTTMEVLLAATLDALGLAPEDVVRTNMDKATAFTAFSAGSGDIVTGDASFYFSALNNGWIPVTTARDMDMFMPAALIANETVINERPEVVQKWLDAYMRSVAWIKENPDEAATMFYDFCEENGVATTEENAQNFVKMQVANIPGKAEQMELFGADGSGDGSVWQVSMAELMDYYVQMGGYTEEDKELLLADDNYNDTFMDAVAE